MREWPREQQGGEGGWGGEEIEQRGDGEEDRSVGPGRDC